MDSLQDYLDIILLFFSNSQTVFWISFILGCVWFYKGEGQSGMYADKLQYTLYMVYRGIIITQIIPYALELLPPEGTPLVSIIMLCIICKHLNLI